MVLFTRKKKPPSRQITFEGKTLHYSPVVRYLGVVLDARLHWKHHIEKKIKQAKGVMMGVGNLVRRSHGPCPRVMRWAYHSLVRPVFSYGSLVWAHELNLQQVLSKMTSLNRMGINSFCHAPRSTPSRLLEVMLDVMPLDLFCKMTALNSYVRLRNILQFEWSGRKACKRYAVSHMRYWTDLAEQLGLDLSLIDSCQETSENRGYKVNNKPTGKKHLVMSQLNVFTDGSKMGHKVGAGYVIYHFRKPLREEKFSLPDNSTVFQAELLAIKEAATTVRYFTDFKFVKFFVDSQAALAAIDKFGIKADVSYISTGGGAFLEFVEGKVLPAVEMLETRAKA